MDTRRLGHTRLVTSRMGLGLAALGRPGYINLGHAADLHRDYAIAAMERNAHCVLDAAWDLGFRYFDAARSYGRAEQFLGTWLAARRIAPGAVVIGSKWGYTYTAGWQVEAKRHEVKDHSLATLQRQIEESRALLGHHLALCQVHSATLESGVLDDCGVLAALARLRAAGIAIGLTLSGPRQAETLRKALGVRVDGEPLFDCVQATWNLLERSAGDALRDAHADGRGVIIKEALANGRLTARNADPAFTAKRRQLAAVARPLASTIDAVALAAVLAQPWADVVLSGAATVDQLQENAAALVVAWNAEADAALAALVEPPDTYWKTRSALPWN